MAQHVWVYLPGQPTWVVPFHGQRYVFRPTPIGSNSNEAKWQWEPRRSASHSLENSALTWGKSQDDHRHQPAEAQEVSKNHLQEAKKKKDGETLSPCLWAAVASRPECPGAASSEALSSLSLCSFPHPSTCERRSCILIRARFGKALTFWIMIVKGPSIWNPRAKYMTLHQPSTRAMDMGTASPFTLVNLITMVTSTREA